VHLHGSELRWPVPLGERWNSMDFDAESLLVFRNTPRSLSLRYADRSAGTLRNNHDNGLQCGELLNLHWLDNDDTWLQRELSLQVVELVQLLVAAAVVRLTMSLFSSWSSWSGRLRNSSDQLLKSDHNDDDFNLNIDQHEHEQHNYDNWRNDDD